jgi:hypothetical protein
MKSDPIVSEVRKNRKEISAKFGFDLKKIIADARSRQNSSGHQLISFATTNQNAS